MVDCPECSEEITYLKFAYKVWETGDYEGNGSYDRDDETEETEDRTNYKCPECYEILFTDEELADRFLNGEITPEPAISPTDSKDNKEKDIYIEI